MKLVSACLLGFDCKYNGSNNLNNKIINLSQKEELIPICPEQSGGLTTPRVPSETTGDGQYVLYGEAKVISKNGKDVTQNFIKGAIETLNVAKKYNIKEAILKARSSSCGCGKIYDGTFTGKLIDGDGVTTALLKQNWIKVITEEDI